MALTAARRFLVGGQDATLDRLAAFGVDGVSDIKVNLRLAMFLPGVGIVAAAIGTEVRINRILEPTSPTLGRHFPAWHRDKESVRFFDDSNIVDDKASIEDHSAVSAQPLVGVIAQIDLNFGYFHSLLPLLLFLSAIPNRQFLHFTLRPGIV